MIVKCKSALRLYHAPWAVPAFSYLDFSLAAVARASDRTESAAVGGAGVDVVLNDRVVENCVEKDEENEEPRVVPNPRVVR